MRLAASLSPAPICIMHPGLPVTRLPLGIEHAPHLVAANPSSQARMGNPVDPRAAAAFVGLWQRHLPSTRNGAHHGLRRIGHALGMDQVAGRVVGDRDLQPTAWDGPARCQELRNVPYPVGERARSLAQVPRREPATCRTPPSRRRTPRRSWPGSPRPRPRRALTLRRARARAASRSPACAWRAPQHPCPSTCTTL